MHVYDVYTLVTDQPAEGASRRRSTTPWQLHDGHIERSELLGDGMRAFDEIADRVVEPGTITYTSVVNQQPFHPSRAQSLGKPQDSNRCFSRQAHHATR